MNRDNENIFLDIENTVIDDKVNSIKKNQQKLPDSSENQEENSDVTEEKVLDTIEFGVDEDGQLLSEAGAKLRVIGIGGGGCKAIECMATSDMHDVDLVALNTDLKALSRLKSKVGQCHGLRLMQLGPKTTRGLGAGSIPENGAKAAQESEENIRKLLSGCDMVFLTVGLGGGTGTGASPLIARIAKEMGVLTIGVATLPFYSEGKRKWRIAVEGKDKLLAEVDSLILIPNQKIAKVYGQKNVVEAYRHSDEILMNAVRGISELINAAGDFGGVDFADVRTCLIDKGLAVISIGYAKNSPKCAQEAIENALNNPMLEDCDISGAQGILGNIIASKNLLVNDVETITNTINELADEEAITKIGTIIKEDTDDGIEVVLVASGISIENFAYNNDSVSQSPNVVGYNELRRYQQAQQQSDSSSGVREYAKSTSTTQTDTHSRQSHASDVVATRDTFQPASLSQDSATRQVENAKSSSLLKPSPAPRSWSWQEQSEREINSHSEQQSSNDEDLRTPAYARKRKKYVNVQRFTGVQAQLWQD